MSGLNRIHPLPVMLAVIWMGLCAFVIANPARPFLGNYSMKAVSYSMVGESFLENTDTILKPTSSILKEGKQALQIMEWCWPVYLVALAKSLFPYSYELWGRILSLALLPLFYAFSYFFLREWGRESHRAHLAAFFASVCPLSLVYFQSFQMEAFAVTLFMFTLWSWSRFVKTNTLIAGLLFFIGSSLTLLLKPNWIFLALGMGYLMIAHQGFKGFVKPGSLTFLLISVLMPCAWILWVIYLVTSGEPIYQSLLRHLETTGSPIVFWFNPMFYANTAGLLFKIVLGPLGFVLLLAGIIKGGRPQGVLDRFFWVYFIGFLLMYFSNALKFNDTSYYYMPLIPWAAFHMERGWTWLMPRIHLFKNQYVIRVSAVIFVACSLLLTYRLILHVPPIERHIVETGRYMDAHTPKDARIIASSGSSPALLYYSRRKGWDLALGKPDAWVFKRFQEGLEHGARYYVNSDVEDLKQSFLWEMLLDEHELLIANKRFAVFKLNVG